MTALGDLLGRLDPDPGRRGKQFERICQWFLTHDPVYARELRRVWHWADWPGRWGADAGIDLVAEDRHGQLWAIQAKAYDAATWITKRDVDTFLSESGRSQFSFRLLIATTDLIGRTAKRTIEAVRIRTAGDPADFSGAPGDPDDLGEQVAALWEAGASRPEWCFVAEDESGDRVGRVGYRVEPTVTNPAWRGTLPPAELFVFGLWLPWEHGRCDLGRVLFASTLDRLAPELPARLDAHSRRQTRTP